MTGTRSSPLLKWYLDNSHENIPIDVYKAFREEFFKELMLNPEGVTLPHNLGWLKIIGNQGPVICKTLTRITKRSWETPIYHNNFHTGGWIFKVEWYSKPIGKTEDVVKRAFFNSDAYGFSPSSTLKKILMTKILSGEWDHFHKKSFFRAPRTKKPKGRPKNISLQEVNEPSNAD